MLDIQNFPALANFVICALVTLSGLYWLRRFSQHDNENRFLFRAYLCWWLSWVVWTATWALLAFTRLIETHQRTILALSDLNTVLLITVYFIITRGNTYKPLVAAIEFVYVCLVLASGYGIFFLFFPERFDDLQMGWGLCISALSTLLVGVAFSFRFKTRAVLAIGFAYAFSQPLAFEAILHSTARHGDSLSAAHALAAFKFTLAILKVVWATVVTVYFTQVPVTRADMVVESNYGPLLPPLRDLPILPLLAQSIALLLAIVVLTGVALLKQYPDAFTHQLIPTLGAVGVLITILTGLTKGVKVLIRFIKQHEAEASKQHT